MENKLFFGIIFLILVLPLVSADAIEPGYHGIRINNQITNINDFPNYVFVSYSTLGGMPRSIDIIGKDGKLKAYYKFDLVSVYAIPKSEFNESYINYLNSNVTANGDLFKIYFNSPQIKKVIANVVSYTTVSYIDPTTEISDSYTIDLNKILTKPTKEETNKNLIYVYILIPIIVLVIIIFIIIKRRK